MSLIERCWRWLYKLCERKIAESVGGLQLKCPICRQWSSIVGLENVQGRVRSGQVYERYRCLGCGEERWWHLMGSVASPMDDRDMPG